MRLLASWWVIALVGCNWAEAERTACANVDGCYARPGGLFPGKGGSVSLVVNLPGPRSEVRSYDAQLARGADLVKVNRGHVLAAYGDGVETELFAYILRRDDQTLLHAVQGPTTYAPASTLADTVSVFRPADPRVSTWRSGGASYEQLVAEPMTLASPTTFSSNNCTVRFLDLQVMRAALGDSVALVYDSTSCAQIGLADRASRGIRASGQGIQTITALGLRDELVVGSAPVRVGRTNGGLTVLDQATSNSLRQLQVPFVGTGFGAASPVQSISSPEALEPGDVSGPAMTGVATGDLTLDFQAPLSGDGKPTAFVAISGHLVRLGETVAGQMVPVVQAEDGNSVFVAWGDPEGKIHLARVSVDGTVAVQVAD